MGFAAFMVDKVGDILGRLVTDYEGPNRETGDHPGVLADADEVQRRAAHNSQSRNSRRSDPIRKKSRKRLGSCGPVEQQQKTGMQCVIILMCTSIQVKKCWRTRGGKSRIEMMWFPAWVSDRG